MELTLFAPLGRGGGNEEGLAGLGSAGGFDVLVTGDMSAFVERMLVKYKDLPDGEVLVAGHHGSRYATSGELLAALKPEVAIISVGYNRFGHPAEEVISRLAAAGVSIFRTDDAGTVVVRSRD
jgi:competence protein ComEC